jgi:hypothetical protein
LRNYADIDVNLTGIDTMHEEPWLLAHQLKNEYLLQLASLLVQVRGEVIDRHEPNLGDTRLSLGMRAYECCRSRIIFKDDQGVWPWLSILTEQGRFTFAVEGVPVRFSRNDPDSLPYRKLIPSQEGFEQMSMFEDENNFSHLRWFLVIDTPYDTPVENAFFIGYSELNEIVCKYEIPLSDRVSAMGDVNTKKPQAVKVSPAKAKLKLLEKKEDNSTNDK